MGNFTRSFETDINFDGDTIHFVLRRYTRSEMNKLSPTIKQEWKNGVANPAEMAVFTDVACGLIPDKIVSMSGLTDSEGNEITDIHEIIDEAYFSQLFMDINNAIMIASVVKKDDEKKSELESGESAESQEQETQDSMAGTN